MDDTFALFSGGKPEALKFLNTLNGLHPSLVFTMESKEDNKLPFLDVLVFREEKEFSSTIYRKPTFTGLYNRWDSYSAYDQKVALIRSLTLRAKRICSPQHLNDEVAKLKAILQGNGYPLPIIERVIYQVLNPKAPVHTVGLKPVFIRLPWLGAHSSSFKSRIRHVTRRAVPWCNPICCFTSRNMFNTSNKDVLPIANLSNVIYLFDCGCGHSYIGRTTQRLGERVKQHVPAGLTHSTTPKESMVTTRKKPGRPRKNNVDRDGDSMHAHVHVSAPISSRT